MSSSSAATQKRGRGLAAAFPMLSPIAKSPPSLLQLELPPPLLHLESPPPLLHLESPPPLLDLGSPPPAKKKKIVSSPSPHAQITLFHVPCAHALSGTSPGPPSGLFLTWSPEATMLPLACQRIQSRPPRTQLRAPLVVVFLGQQPSRRSPPLLLPSRPCLPSPPPRPRPRPPCFSLPLSPRTPLRTTRGAAMTRSTRSFRSSSRPTHGRKDYCREGRASAGVRSSRRRLHRGRCRLRWSGTRTRQRLAPPEFEPQGCRLE